MGPKVQRGARPIAVFPIFASANREGEGALCLGTLENELVKREERIVGEEPISFPQSACVVQTFVLTESRSFKQSFDFIVTTVSNEAEAGTRQRIMETAERLFAEQGFEAVSLRELTQEAEVNLAAVHYHFGGKEELIDQMTSRYMNWVNADRLALLEKLEERGEPAEVAEIVEAFLQPLRTVVSQSERSEAIFYKFMGRCISERNHRLPSEAAELFQRMVSRFSQALERAVPHLDEEELLWRLHFTVGVMVQTLLHADWLPTISQGRSGRPDSETVMRRMTQFCAFGYRAPATDESK